jgi:ketosteroid isomerase-like protein
MDNTRFLANLRDAVNDHDLDAVADCFTEDYCNETPVHPARSFVGREQVRDNWQQIFGGVPDIRATVLRDAGGADSAWAEWEFTGTRRDGAAHVMRGVTVFGLRDGRASWSRFYVEPVDDDTTGVHEHIDRTVADHVNG